MEITLKRLRESAVKRAEGCRSSGGDLCQVTRQQHVDLYLPLYLKPPRTIDGVIKTHMLWSRPPRSPDRCAEGQQLLFPCPQTGMDAGEGPSLAHTHLSHHRVGKFSTTWLSSLHRVQLYVLCAGGDGFPTGNFEHFCHFHIHHTRGFNPRTQSFSHPPYKYTLSTR